MLAVSTSNCIKVSANRRMIKKKRILQHSCDIAVWISNCLWFEKVHQLCHYLVFDLQPHRDAPVQWSEHMALTGALAIHILFLFFPPHYGIECLPRHKRGRGHPATACQQNDMPYFELRRVYLSPAVTHYQECMPLFQAVIQHINRKFCMFSMT